MPDSTGQCSRTQITHGVIGVIEQDGRWLMIKRAEGLKAAGAWCFPGGAIQLGESPEAALVREIREEVALSVHPGQCVWRWTNEMKSLHLQWWTTQNVTGDVVPNPAEVADFRWVAPSDIPTLPDILPNNIEFAVFAKSNGLFNGYMRQESRD